MQDKFQFRITQLGKFFNLPVEGVSFGINKIQIAVINAVLGRVESFLDGPAVVFGDYMEVRVSPAAEERVRPLLGEFLPYTEQEIVKQLRKRRCRGAEEKLTIRLVADESLSGLEVQAIPKERDGSPAPSYGSVVVEPAYLFRLDGQGQWEVPHNREVIVGRSYGADIDLGDKKVSQSHLMARALVRHNGTEAVQLRELGSMNGTLFRGRRLAKDESVRAEHGDVVTLAPERTPAGWGGGIRLRVVIGNRALDRTQEI